MRIVFYVAEKDRNYGLAEALQAGARVHGDEVDIVPQKQFAGVRQDYDGAAALGVKRAGKRLLAAHLQVGGHFLFFDKGYMQRSSYARVAIDSWQPLAYFRKKRPSDRFDRLGIRLAPLRAAMAAAHIIFAGSSQKYAQFHDLGDATEYAARVIRKIMKKSRRAIVYRPKPSWAQNHPEECQPIEGTRFSPPATPIHTEFNRCHLLVTHGSNAAFDALAAGVPIMVLGEGICKPVALPEDWGRVEDPFWPGDEERQQFFCDAAYCQWTLDEYRSGEAWADIRSTLAELGAGRAIQASPEQVIAQYRLMHEHPKYFRGREAQKHFAKIGRLILQTGSQSIIDYGCGKGEQYEQPIALGEAWGVEVAKFDPGYAPFAEKPKGSFDGAICCDVMEHVLEAHVGAVLREVMQYARRFAFFSISTTPASKTLPNGWNCHLTVRPEAWWRAQLEAARRDVAPDLLVEASITTTPEVGKEFADDE